MERVKSQINEKLEERKKLKNIYNETMTQEREKLAKEKATAKVEAQIEKAKYNAKNPKMQRIGKSLASGAKGVGSYMAKLEKKAGRSGGSSGGGSSYGGGFGIGGSDLLTGVTRSSSAGSRRTVKRKPKKSNDFGEWF